MNVLIPVWLFNIACGVCGFIVVVALVKTSTVVKLGGYLRRLTKITEKLKAHETAAVQKWLLRTSVEDLATHLDNGGSLDRLPDSERKPPQGGSAMANVERIHEELKESRRITAPLYNPKPRTPRPPPEICPRCKKEIAPGYLEGHYVNVHNAENFAETERSLTGERWIGFYNMTQGGGKLWIHTIPITQKILTQYYPSAQQVETWAKHQWWNRVMPKVGEKVQHWNPGGGRPMDYWDHMVCAYRYMELFKLAPIGRQDDSNAWTHAFYIGDLGVTVRRFEENHTPEYLEYLQRSQDPMHPNRPLPGVVMA